MPGYFTEDPVESFRRNVWINPFWEDDVDEVVELMGADRVIFGSDWPHIEGMPQPLDYATELKEFDDATRQQDPPRQRPRAEHAPPAPDVTKFAVVGTDHLHVVELVSGLLEAGAELAAIAATEDRIGPWLASQHEGARIVPDLDAALDGVDVVVTAAIPADRAEIGEQSRCARARTCSPTSRACTSLEQLAALRHAHAETGQTYTVLFSERLTNDGDGARVRARRGRPHRRASCTPSGSGRTR